MGRTKMWLGIVVFALCVPGFVRAEGAKVEEKLVGPVQGSVGFTLSPRGARCATQTMKGSRNLLLIDGEEQPAFDELIAMPEMQVTGPPVLFSPDGKRYAYISRVGNEFVIILDGKELARGPMDSFQPAGGMAFSPDGSHFYYSTVTEDRSGYVLMLDGKPGPATGPDTATGAAPVPVFSPDGKRHAYAATKADTGEPALVVDGELTAYAGTEPRFSPDSKQLITVLRSPNSNRTELLVDGKPAYADESVKKIQVAPDGKRFVAVKNELLEGGRGNHDVVVVDGQRVDGSECVAVKHVVFSPDSKHYAAICETKNRAFFLIRDGQRTPEYTYIQHSGIGAEFTPAFTPDSSKLVFVAANNNIYFLNVGDKEYDGYPILRTFMASNGRVGFVGATDRLHVTVGVDDEKIDGLQDVGDIWFSPDGSRYAFLSEGNKGGLYLDGKLPKHPYNGGFMGKTNMEPIPLAFSPDGKHVAYLTRDPKGNQHQRYIVLDDALIPAPSLHVSRPMFTPDGKHFMYVGWQNPKYTLYVDGKPAVTYLHIPELAMFHEPHPVWEMSEEGVLTFVAAQEDGIKRFTVTPSPDEGVETMTAGAGK